MIVVKKNVSQNCKHTEWIMFPTKSTEYSYLYTAVTDVRSQCEDINSLAMWHTVEERA